MAKKTGPSSSHAERLRLAAAMAGLARLLGNPSRLSMIMLLDAGELSAGQLVDATGVNLMSVSHDLALFRHAGVVTSRRVGRQVLYNLNERGRGLAEVVRSLGG